MNKHDSPANCDVHELILKRWSPVVFSSLPVEDGKLRALFEAARWAPSSMNEQPWHFMVATSQEREEFDRMLDCLHEDNARWAGHAPVLVLSVVKLGFESSGRENRHAWHDAGLATQNLLIQATAMGLHAHPMGGFSRSKAIELFQIPDGYDPVVMLALGYLGDPGNPPEGVEERDISRRSRRSTGEFVFTGRWGEISTCI